ncbi:hypothetical protein IC582_002567 [Cucumis melo]
MFLFPQLFVFCCFFVALVMAEFSHGQTTQTNDVLTQGQPLSIGSQLISSTATFVLGFYNPQSSNSTYLGISYNTNDQKPIWIANRNSPFPNNSASIILIIDVNGSLKIQNGNYSFSLFNGGQPTTSSAILQDDGNFVLRELNRDGSVKQILWQSFDHPTDTLLPGMKIGINHKTNSTWSLTSWRSNEYPKPGDFRLGMNPNNTYELMMFIRDALLWRSGNWKDGSFEFLSYYQGTINFNRVSNENETYFIYYIPKLDRYSVHRDSYEYSYEYRNSGEFILPQLRLENDGVLTINDQKYFPLACLTPQDEVANSCVWKKQDKIPECRNKLSYDYGPLFSVINGYNLERINGSSYYYERSGNFSMFDCQSICINDCDCIAFAIPAYESDSGCEFWKSGAEFSTDQYDSSQMIWSLYTDNYEIQNGKWKVWVQITVALTIPATFLLLCFIIYAKWRTQIFKAIRKVKKGFLRGMGMISEGYNILRIMIIQIRDGKKNPELQFFDFETILSATNSFGDDCKLGQGGFGPVYKGVMTDGQEVAIKRLSKNSGQGLVEFKNETILIAKLQHTNLVRLIGCCLHKEEKLLVYEYMPNKSLDFFLFDSEKKLILDWEKRLHVVQGIVQGLLYLHYYSRVRIIHRDLKVSNILLDDEMNAKISDFGMARVFKPSDNEANTSRVVGTYGYISPEYAMEGIFSIKSDVYSFGILLLEIITSQKNYNNYDSERPLNLIGYAWELWVNGRGEELIDLGLCNSNDQKAKALRCIHVSLLCVQQIAADRPTMLDIYFMINNDSAQLPSPKQPAFFVAQNPSSSEREMEEVDSELTRPIEPTPEICSLNSMTLSTMVAR